MLSLLLLLTLTLSITTAYPHHHHRSNTNISNPNTNPTQNTVYWGQSGSREKDLSSYCAPSSGIDIIILSFLYQYGNGQRQPGGTIGEHCKITAGVAQNCESVIAGIESCKVNGVKVILSLGGAEGTYSLSSREEAEAIAQNLWDSYGNSNPNPVPNGSWNGDANGNWNGNWNANGNTILRPFGKSFVNGWDFDIESNRGNEFYPFLIAKLRANFAKDPSNTYIITGAPQCPIPEPNMQGMIAQAQFDYLFIQFYNNPECSMEKVNFDAWAGNISTGASANAKLFLGVPAAPLAANGQEDGARYFFQPGVLAALVKGFAARPQFGGVMMWAAGFSDSSASNGCTYAQHAKKILRTGGAC
ncbi:glycoside hydrolase superfamily [Aspergillus avenaceus]|uniref:Glycoside hydrolase superfamily n=1 Tax=Aspergillus avenaceus TaxID=36643 RepID=A0A5N6TKG5_ASPAV|nr:glycoside hydrolase superfamily [Aspergillus avenaceus]